MCVAAVIFSPVPLNYLECMENDNPHGAGVAWLDGEQIRFVRGLTAVEIHNMQEAGEMSYPYLLHFRWATHGDKVPELTHPFPLGPRALLGELSGHAKSVLIHNGTWSGYDRTATAWINAGNYEIPAEILDTTSDTAVAAWLALDNQDLLDEIMWATAVAEIMDGVDEHGAPKKTMEITTRGQWYDKEGNWYSNLNWEPWNGSNFYSTRGNHSADTYEEWANGYYHGEGGSTKPDPESPYKDIDWDLYFTEPFSTRAEEFSHLNFDQYVERFRKKSAPNLIDTRPDTVNELSWNDFLVARYGPEVAATLQADIFPEEDKNYRGGNKLPLVLTDGSKTADEYEAEAGAEASIDPDIISEDWETVNAVLERQMRGRWSA